MSDVMMRGPDGYEALATVFRAAMAQAASGKGRRRHARDGVPFDRQPIMELGRMHGLGFLTGQAAKKAQEATRLPTMDAQEQELLGVINYAAAAVLLVWEMQQAEREADAAREREGA